MNKTQIVELENYVYQYIYQNTSLQPQTLQEWDMFNESISLTVSTLHEQAIQEADKRFNWQIYSEDRYPLGSFKQQAEICSQLMDWQKGFECYKQLEGESMLNYKLIQEECGDSFFSQECKDDMVSVQQLKN
eukprot:TRINITY_DN57857_c0_g1_i1.p2 TRINITY_DN57857_c0_g1~~TRINITY_DN57857_c0_g1_i1.p2  ORF type:complete len:132 (-),score=4.34 TRINITY_DN57857_c0_g1_i1:28-423(-)